MAGMNCDILFSYSNKKEYFGLLNYRNTIAMQVQRVFDASPSTPPITWGLPTLITGAYTGIVVNGIDFGTGRIVSYSNPVSTDIKENGRHLWTQIVNFEVYESGDSSNLTGIFTGVLTSGIYPPTLQNLEEQFTFDIGSDGSYQYGHSANVKCVDEPTGLSGYIVAQRVASGLLATTPPFGYIDSVHSGFYTSAVGRRLYSETVNIFDGSANFEEKFVIQSRDFLKHAVSFDNGFMNVSESVTLRHSGVSTISGAITSNDYGINTRYSSAFGGAYTRCNSLYGTYAAVIGSDAYATSLSLQPTQITKVFDERSQELTYSVVYTNNPNMTTNGYALDREQNISENSLGTLTASENATLIAYDNKNVNTNSLLAAGIATEISGAPTRITPYYSNINILKKESESKSLSSLGKRATYTVTFTSDPSFVNDGVFLAQSLEVQNNLPIRMHSPYLVIGKKKPLMHSPGQTELGNIICSYSATLVRPLGYSPSIPAAPSSALNTIFLQALNRALLEASYKSPTDTFATKVSYSYDSNFAITATVELQYLFPKESNM